MASRSDEMERREGEKTTGLVKVWEGRMGNDLTPTYEVWLNGELVGFAKRKWLAQAIFDAIRAGHIEGTGDTTMRFAKWASENAPDLYNRMPEYF